MNANIPVGPQTGHSPKMKIVVELEVDPMGLNPRMAERIVSQHLPNYIVDHGHTVHVTGAKIVRTT